MVLVRKPTTLIYGGNGKTARELTKLLTSPDADAHSPPHTVHSIIRDPSQIPDLQRLGAHPHVLPIDTTPVDEFAALTARLAPDYVVWAAGAGPDAAENVDHLGAVKAMDALARASACITAPAGQHVEKKFITISALDVRDRCKRPTPDWYNSTDKSLSDRIWAAIGPVMQAKLEADRDLRTRNDSRGLKYTILRPGRLGEAEGDASIEAGKVHFGEAIARADLARVIVECMRNEGTVGLAFDVVGGKTPVGDAVAKAAKDRVDTFEGYY